MSSPRVRTPVCCPQAPFALANPGCTQCLHAASRGYVPEGISQDKLPLYLSFFQFVHDARLRGNALLGTLVTRRARYQPGSRQEPHGIMRWNRR